MEKHHDGNEVGVLFTDVESSILPNLSADPIENLDEIGEQGTSPQDNTDSFFLTDRYKPYIPYIPYIHIYYIPLYLYTFTHYRKGWLQG